MKTRITVETNTPKTIKGRLLLSAIQRDSMKSLLTALNLLSEIKTVNEDFFVDGTLDFLQVKAFVNSLGENFILSSFDTF